MRYLISFLILTLSISASALDLGVQYTATLQQPFGIGLRLKTGGITSGFTMGSNSGGFNLTKRTELTAEQLQTANSSFNGNLSANRYFVGVLGSDITEYATVEILAGSTSLQEFKKFDDIKTRTSFDRNLAIGVNLIGFRNGYSIGVGYLYTSGHSVSLSYGYSFPL